MTSINQLRTQMNHILSLRDKFVEVSGQSDEKLSSMIETAKRFHDGLQPLNKEVEQLQNRIKNLEYCINGLSHVQDFYKTGREVERTIYEGPGSSLDNYLAAMDRIRDSLAYFDQNNTEHAEHSRLNALFSNGLKSLQKLFDETLQNAFAPILPERLYKLVEKEDTISIAEDQPSEAAGPELEQVSPEVTQRLQQISAWLRKVDSSNMAAQRFQKTDGPRLPDSLNRYCDFRKDLMRLSLVRLREYQKTQENSAPSGRSRIGVSNRSLDLVPPGRKRPPNKAYGLVWDANSRRGMAEGEDLDSEHYNTSLSAFILLFENDRSLLDRLKLSSNSHEARFACITICKGAANDLLSEGNLLVRLMNRATGRGEFHMIISLLVVLRRFSELAKSFTENLKILAPYSQPFNDLVHRLRVQSRQTLDSFVQQLSPTAGGNLVPPDATVHELASNALLFLEKLMEYESIVDVILVWDEASFPPEASIDYLASLTSNCVKGRAAAFGSYILQVVAAVIANIDKKSENYPEDIQKLVFQMNNVQYIIKTLQSTGLHEQLSLYENSAIDKFQNLLQDRKKFYVRGVTDMLYLAPTTGTEGAIRHLRNTASLWGAALVTAVSAHASPRLSKSNSSAVSRLQLSSTAAAGTISLPQPAALNPLSNVVTSARSTSSTSDKVLCFSCCCRMFSLSGIHLRRLLRIVEKRMLSTPYPLFFFACRRNHSSLSFVFACASCYLCLRGHAPVPTIES
uniref:Exocyst complex component 7 n=3 Tax=Schistocephalus solidus TaxID=70667 RepID=A0A0V0JD14_SCHSO